jgi:demethylmenaquinone methyltransferase/2-methoxy-6-polyprenyl-1,4-benzoquinol methylase
VSALPAAADKAAAVEAMFDRIAPRYDRLNRILTFRMDLRWRRATVRALHLPGAAQVVDVACGTGDLCDELHRMGYRAVGTDFSVGMLAAAHTTVPLLRADALTLPLRNGSVDGITCGFALRNFTALEPVLAECARVLRPGGRIALLEVGTPRGRLARAGHRVWFHRIVPFVGGLISDRDAYRYLPASTAYLPTPPALARMLLDAGFDDVERDTFLLGAAQLVTATRR